MKITLNYDSTKTTVLASECVDEINKALSTSVQSLDIRSNKSDSLIQNQSDIKNVSQQSFDAQQIKYLTSEDAIQCYLKGYFTIEELKIFTKDEIEVVTSNSAKQAYEQGYVNIRDLIEQKRIEPRKDLFSEFYELTCDNAIKLYAKGVTSKFIELYGIDEARQLAKLYREKKTEKANYQQITKCLMGISNISDEQKLQEAYDSFVKKFTKSQKITNPNGDNNETTVISKINKVLKNAAEEEETQAKEGSENQDSNIANSLEARPFTKMLTIIDPDMPANCTQQLAEEFIKTFPNGEQTSIVDVELLGVLEVLPQEA